MKIPMSVQALRLTKGDVVQLGVEGVAPAFQGKLAFIDEVKAWGLVVRVEAFRGDAYYRVPYGAFAEVGEAQWVRVAEDELTEKTNKEDGHGSDVGAEDDGGGPDAAAGDRRL